MAARAGVLRRVPVRRAVAAERRAALLARAKVHPARVDLHALVALAPCRLDDLRDLLDVRAGIGGHGDVFLV